MGRSSHDEEIAASGWTVGTTKMWRYTAKTTVATVRASAHQGRLATLFFAAMALRESHWRTVFDREREACFLAARFRFVSLTALLIG